jgi:hypothetical protein
VALGDASGIGVGNVCFASGQSETFDPYFSVRLRILAWNENIID